MSLKYQDDQTERNCSEDIEQFVAKRQISKEIVLLPLGAGYEYDGKHFDTFADIDDYWWMRRCQDWEKRQM